jgi:hypothetical protein
MVSLACKSLSIPLKTNYKINTVEIVILYWDDNVV